MPIGDRMAWIVQAGMDNTSAIVQDGMDEVKGAASPAKEILQRFLDAGEIQIKGSVFGFNALDVTIPIPDKKEKAKP